MIEHRADGHAGAFDEPPQLAHADRVAAPFWRIEAEAVLLGQLLIPPSFPSFIIQMFDGREMVHASNTPGILSRRALPSRRLARLGATLDFHHGLLANDAPQVLIQPGGGAAHDDFDGRNVSAIVERQPLRFREQLEQRFGRGS
jgi:hypothetical protein